MNMNNQKETTNSQSTELNGSLLAGRFKIIRELGTGGMGKVLLAEDTLQNNDLVAVKVLYPSVAKNAQSVARFKNEMLLNKKLSHSGIVHIHDLGESDDSYFISMEYVDGESLGNRIKDTTRPRLSFPEIIDILYNIAVALDYAHTHSVIHRDLKPDNVLLPTTGGIKITDFGVARSLEQERGLTMTGEIVGTAYYMAPEQFHSSSVDERADIYSLGILAFEMATGVRPFDKDAYISILAMHLTEDIPTISEYNPDTPRWYQDFVETCAEKEPERRFQSMAEVAEELLDYREKLKNPNKPSLINKLLGFFQGS